MILNPPLVIAFQSSDGVSFTNGKITLARLALSRVLFASDGFPMLMPIVKRCVHLGV